MSPGPCRVPLSGRGGRRRGPGQVQQVSLKETPGGCEREKGGVGPQIGLEALYLCCQKSRKKAFCIESLGEIFLV